MLHNSLSLFRLVFTYNSDIVLLTAVWTKSVDVGLCFCILSGTGSPWEALALGKSISCVPSPSLQPLGAPKSMKSDDSGEEEKKSYIGPNAALEVFVEWGQGQESTFWALGRRCHFPWVDTYASVCGLASKEGLNFNFPIALWGE